MGLRKRFKRKPGPALTRGRLQHALVGAGGTALGFVLWGQGGAVLVSASIIALGAALEYFTRELSESLGWGHPFGDAIDYAAYLAGSLAVFLRL